MRTDTAIVVLSGGQDSTCCLFAAKAKFKKVFAITFDYNQRHKREIEAAKKIVELASIENHEIINLGSIFESDSPLTNLNKDLELYPNFKEMSETIGGRVELTFVAGRNLLFLAIAANRAFAHKASAVYTGICQEDSSNYPDTRQKFLVNMVGAITTALGIEDTPWSIKAPLMFLSKADTIRLSLTLPGCYTATGYSHTSYDGAYPPTGKDHATTLRAHGFEEAGVPDPLVVRAFLEGLMELPDTKNYNSYKSVLRTYKRVCGDGPSNELTLDCLNAMELVIVAELGIVQVPYAE